jgi:hypothetical protein
MDGRATAGLITSIEPITKTSCDRTVRAQPREILVRSRQLLAHDREVQASDHKYHESLFTLDLPSRLALWQEKDSYYRAPLIRGISSA